MLRGSPLRSAVASGIARSTPRIGAFALSPTQDVGGCLAVAWASVRGVSPGNRLACLPGWMSHNVSRIRIGRRLCSRFETICWRGG